jgi:multidrug transporter EmrE-like cation transporter
MVGLIWLILAIAFEFFWALCRKASALTHFGTHILLAKSWELKARTLVLPGTE